MNIVNVTPGLIPIPPPTWGAVEKIIWEIHTNLMKMGHNSQIKYLNEVKPSDEIVHIHVANLANMAYEMGIPYYFTFHDHHAFLYGKDSTLYKENLIAMKNAVRSFVPAKYLVDYFDNIPEYFSHGVNTDFFKPIEKDNFNEIKLLCVANNGFIYNQSEDRKGFGLAIQAAQVLELPITIAGPSNNKNFFNEHPPTYNKLTILYDLPEPELLKVYQNHSIFIHMSVLEAGHPNLTLLEAISCGLPVVGTFESNNHLGGMEVVNRDLCELINGIKKVISHYEKYRTEAIDQASKLSWSNRTKELIKFYNTKITMREQLIMEYGNTQKKYIKPKGKDEITTVNILHHFIDGPMVEIRDTQTHKYLVQFINGDTEDVEYQLEMESNHWAKAAKKYYLNWIIRVQGIDTDFFYEHKFNPEGKRFLISFESKSLGDTLAWIPYVDKFQRDNKCTVICSTFLNDLFKKEYPNIQFVNPGSVVYDLYGEYRFGIFYDGNDIDLFMNVTDVKKEPLAKIASDILGLEYEEIKPKITLHKNVMKKKQVSIAIHSTAQCKYWNNPKGWQEVVDYLNGLGYEVILLSKEDDGYMGNKQPKGVKKHPNGSLSNIIRTLQESEFFIGISGGLSWLSWAVGIPTILISGFTEKKCEPQNGIHRVINEDVCYGCWSTHKFDPGKWNWCPLHEKTDRQFECSKTITSDMVIKEIDIILNKRCDIY